MKERGESSFKPLLDHIRSQRGVDFSSYKQATLRRRIAKRMQELGLEDYGDYLDRLQASPDEFEPLLDALFINVTGFFRDPPAWEVVKSEVIPDILRAAGDESVRVWCAGVASGQEVYTCAMLLAEAMGEDAFLARTKIFATDVDEGALAQARNALYRPEEVEDVPETLRARYFTPAGGKLQFRIELRRAVIFGLHNLLVDAPISRVHLLVCRNTLMYLNRDAQNKILAGFHFALRPEGYLFLGRAEMLLTRRNIFTPVDGKVRIFRKVSDLSFSDRIAVMSQSGGEEEEQSVIDEVHIREIAFDTSPVPEIVIDGGGTLSLANRAARSLFGLGRSDLGRPFHELDLSYKPAELRGPIELAQRQGEQSEISSVAWSGPDGVTRTLDLRVLPLMDDGKAVAVKVAFMDVSRHRELTLELTESRRELQTAYEELQSTNEELETTNEELQSTVEELETTNEELQATNEELETMNEELQSTNIEIETVNEELQERTAELGRLNMYVHSIVNSMGEAVIVLDRDLKVRTWNGHSEELWGLRSADVQGKALLALDFGLPVKGLKEALTSCVDGDGDGAIVVLGHDRRGKPVEYHARCVPLRDSDGGITGVITLVNGQTA